MSCLKKIPISIFILAMILCLNLMSHSPQEKTDWISGIIYFENGNRLEFLDVTSLIFSMKGGAESVPKNVTEWTKHYGKISMSTSVPLAWVKSIETTSYETKNRYRCLFNPEVTIETVNGVRFQSEYKHLEWIRVKTRGESSGDVKEQYIYFARDNKINIRKIVFNNRIALS